MIHFIAAYWPWLGLAAVLFLLPLIWIAIEVAAAPLFGPDEQPIATAEEVLAAVDEAFADALHLPRRPQHAGHRDDEGGAE